MRTYISTVVQAKLVARQPGVFLADGGGGGPAVLPFETMAPRWDRPGEIQADIAKVEAEILALEQRREDLEYELARVMLTRPSDAELAAKQRNPTKPADATATPTPPAGSHAPSVGTAEPTEAPSPPTGPGALPEFLSTAEAAELLGMSAKGLEAMRARGQGPAFVRIGRSVRYPRTTLLKPGD